MTRILAAAAAVLSLAAMPALAQTSSPTVDPSPAPTFSTPGAGVQDAPTIGVDGPATVNLAPAPAGGLEAPEASTSVSAAAPAAPPAVGYPICKTRSQDSCRVAGHKAR